MTLPRAAGPHRPTLIIGLALFALAAITFNDAWHMKVRSGYGMGADAASYFVAAFLAVLAAGHLLAAFRPQDSAEPADWVGVTWVSLGLGGLLLSVWLGGGFVLGATLLFAMTARAFGRRALLADLALGFAIGLGIFLMFSKLLTLTLPMGPFERLF